jgi:tetratricopeptide (TPR) repeat protein
VARIGTLLALFWIVAGLVVGAQQKPVQPPKPPPVKDQDVVEPPEEDESLKPRVYSFNPLEAQKDVMVGNQQFKAGHFKAAAKRFEEATKYDPAYAEAYLRLGETMEKLRDKKGYKAAYGKYLELKPDSKSASSIRKKIGG